MGPLHGIMNPHAEFHRTQAELEAATAWVNAAPVTGGNLAGIVRRPRTNEREELNEALLDPDQGLLGDRWQTRRNSGEPLQPMDFATQLTLMNARAAQAVAGQRERWGLAGDQLFVDLDLSEANVPAGTRLQIGAVVVEITAPPHTGCKKFLQRFGPGALAWVNSEEGKRMHLRGVNAKIIQGGTVRVGDPVVKLG